MLTKRMRRVRIEDGRITNCPASCRYQNAQFDWPNSVRTRAFFTSMTTNVYRCTAIATKANVSPSVLCCKRRLKEGEILIFAPNDEFKSYILKHRIMFSLESKFFFKFKLFALYFNIRNHFHNFDFDKPQQFSLKHADCDTVRFYLQIFRTK